MQLRNVIVGIGVTAVLVVILGVTRLAKTLKDVDVLELEKIETLSLTPPPAPEMEPEETVVEDVPPPQLAAMEDLRPQLDLDVPPIKAAQRPNLPQLAVELFGDDEAPAALPQVRAPKPVKSVSKPKVRSKPSPTKVKTNFSLGELDGKPRVLRKGRFRWPSGVRGTSVSASLRVELDTSGRPRLISINSISDPKFRSIIPQFLSGTRFTVPRKNGRPVKSTFIWPVTLKKP